LFLLIVKKKLHMKHLDQLRIRQLQLLVWLADGMTLNAAAERLHVSAAAVSLMLKELEVKVGRALFMRDRRGARPNKAGEKLAQRASVILREFELFTEEIAQLDAARVAFRLGAIPQMMMQAIPRVVARIKREAAGALVVHEGTTRELLRDVLAGELGAAIVRVGLGSLDDRSRAELAVEMLRDENAAIAVPRSHPFARRKKFDPAEFESIDWVLSSPDSYLRSMLDLYLQRHALTLRSVVLQVDSTVQALWAAARLNAAAVGPVSLIRTMSKQWNIVALPLVTGEPVRLGLVYRKSQHALPQFAQIRAAIKSELGST
jgi:LysR family transcriptional regulator, cyn operon transcriptional activator